MVNLVLRIVINAVALYVAARILGENMQLADSAGGLLIVAVIFGLVNALIKPVVTILTCPFNILTLGLFTFVINALMLMLTGWITEQLFGDGLVSTQGFWWALVAGIIISIVSTILSMFLSDGDKR
jgi:putative membrane protein